MPTPTYDNSTDGELIVKASAMFAAFNAYHQKYLQDKTAVMHYRGSVANMTALYALLDDPDANLTDGDVYNIITTGENFAYVTPTGSGTHEDADYWDNLGNVVDLTGYATETWVNNKFANNVSFGGNVSVAGILNSTGNISSNGEVSATETVGGQTITHNLTDKLDADDYQVKVNTGSNASVSVNQLTFLDNNNSLWKGLDEVRLYNNTDTLICKNGVTTGLLMQNNQIKVVKVTWNNNVPAVGSTVGYLDGSGNFTATGTVTGNSISDGTGTLASLRDSVGNNTSNISSLQTSVNGKAAKGDSIKSISRSGTTFTATRADGTTFTFTQQDNNTWNANAKSTAGYVAAPGAVSNYGYLTDSSGNPAWRNLWLTKTATISSSKFKTASNSTSITYWVVGQRLIIVPANFHLLAGKTVDSWATENICTLPKPLSTGVSAALAWQVTTDFLLNNGSVINIDTNGTLAFWNKTDRPMGPDNYFFGQLVYIAASSVT